MLYSSHPLLNMIDLTQEDIAPDVSVTSPGNEKNMSKPAKVSPQLCLILVQRFALELCLLQIGQSLKMYRSGEFKRSPIVLALISQN